MTSSEALARLLRCRPAVFLAEGAATSAFDRDRVFGVLRGHLINNGIAIAAFGDDFDRLADEVSKCSGADAVLWSARKLLAEINPSSDCKQLSRINWSAVISVARSLAFERCLAERLDGEPSQREVTRISHPTQIVPRRTIPVFRLMGEPTHLEHDHALPLGAAELALRRPMWRDLLRRFPDFAQASPLFVAGVRGTESIELEALGALFSLAGPVPNEVVFIDCDSAQVAGPTRQLLERRATVQFLGASLQTFCDVASEIFRPTLQPELAAPVEKSLAEVLVSYSDQISVPQTRLPASFNAESHYHELCDALFRPGSIDWRPFAAGLDFRRDCVDELKARIAAAVATSSVGTTPLLLVVGEAGIGKTTALKRAVFESAKDGITILWIRRSFAADAQERFNRLVETLAKSAREGTSVGPLVFVCDDPAGCGINPQIVLERLNSSPLRASVVVAWRSSETGLGPIADWSAQFPTQEFPIPYELSQGELDRFPKFLQALKIVDAEERGAKLVRELPKTQATATDILCGLWFLVPATRHQLEQSITDEFLRLGNPGTGIEAFAQFASSDADIAKSAYEAVAVCSAINLPLPIEVLVASLGVRSYSDWLAVAAPGKAVWGLIYDDVNEESGTITYRTRNVVVTQVLERHIRGEGGSSGEYRVLRRLVQACTDGGECYEVFLSSLLVERSKELQQRLSYTQGLDLYELAIEAKVGRPSVFLHHRGIWARKMGKDYKKAHESFERALHQILKEDGVGERRENVLVSVASTAVDEMAAHQISPEAARRTIEDKLNEVRLLRGFHPHASHVLVRSLNRVAANSATPPDERIAALCQALEESERVVMLLSATDRIRPRDRESVEYMLSEQATAIGQMGDDEDAIDAAHRMAENGSLRALAALGYKQLFQAAISGKGSDYNDVFGRCGQWIDRYKGSPDVSRLHKVRALVMARWRIFEPRGQIDWPVFRSDIEVVLKSEKYGDDPIWAYFKVLATTHIGGLLTSQADWAALRVLVKDHPTRHAIRNFYLNKEGVPKKLQSVIRKSNGRLYANILGENVDVPIHEGDSRYKMDDSPTCYLVFSFMGPIVHFGKAESIKTSPAIPTA